MERIWILVYTHRGIIYSPEIFKDEKSAIERKKEIFKKVNKDYDEIEIFEKSIA